MQADKKRSPWIPIALGIAVAALFLYLTFRNLDVGTIFSQVTAVHPLSLLSMALLSLSTLLLRGFRWWLLLPQAERSEVWPVQRALLISYGANNVASRLAELVRIGFFVKNSKRTIAEVSSTVAVDRIIFDFVPFVMLFVYVIHGFKGSVTSLIPELELVFPPFVAVTAIGIVGLFVLALRPGWFLAVPERLGLPKLPFIWHRLVALVEGLSQGLTTLSNPRQLLVLWGLNLVIWLLPFFYFWVAIDAFSIEMTLAEAVLIFAISILGVVVPSPGGVGTIHYFVSLSLVHFLGVSEADAAAAAVYSHAVNFLVVTVVALLCLLIPVKGQQGDTP